MNVSIGIEILRRGQFQLSRTKDKIERLNESIKKRTFEGMETVIAGLKVRFGICCADCKDILSGLSGDGIARQQVMHRANGWTAKCN